MKNVSLRFLNFNAHYRQKFGLEPKPLAGKEVIAHLADVNQEALQKFIDTLQLKAYSPNTIRTYVNEFAQLLYFLEQENVNNLKPEPLREYFLHCRNVLKLSENTIHSRINAVKFYYEQILKHNRIFIDIPRPKKRVILPNVLAISQV